jgi:hypothetical protein
MKKASTDRTTLIITPEFFLLKTGESLLWLSSLDELIHHKLKALDVLIDGFSQDFTSGSLPIVSLLDRRLAVSYKLSRTFKKIPFYGGTFFKNGRQIQYKGFGFRNTKTLEPYLKTLCQMNIPILSIKSLIFSAAPGFLSHFLKHVNTKGVLWILPYWEKGQRFVFYHNQEIKFVRIIPDVLQDATTEINLLRTLAHIQNECGFALKDLSLLITSPDPEGPQILKDLSCPSSIYRWDRDTLCRISRPLQEKHSNLIELWLFPFAQESETARLITHSCLTTIIQRNRFLKVGQLFLQALCLAGLLLIAKEAYQLWEMEIQKKASVKQLQEANQRMLYLTKQVRLPKSMNPLDLQNYIEARKVKRSHEDVTQLLSNLSPLFQSKILLQEFLWQSTPKPLLKLSLNVSQLSPAAQKKEIAAFKIALGNLLKKTDQRSFDIHQPALQVLEIIWP